MHTIQTAYFGELAYSEANVIHFERGLPGFEHERDFVSIAREDCQPLIFLQSLATEKLCFVTLPVPPIYPGYDLDPQAEDLDALGLPPGTRPAIGSEFACLAIVSVNEDGPATANLLAPVVIHVPGRRAAQVIQSNPDYLLHHPIGGAACS